jgi:hypothetical protein
MVNAMPDEDQYGDLGIPDFSKRVKGDKEPTPKVVSKGEPMSETVETIVEAPARKPRKTPSKVNGAAKPAKVAKAKAKAAKPAKAAAKVKAKGKRERKEPLDAFGFRVDCLKSQAAAMYAGKKGATLGEVKKALKSSQLNLLTELEGRGFKVSKVKESGPGGRDITRYFLRAK